MAKARLADTHTKKDGSFTNSFVSHAGNCQPSLEELAINMPCLLIMSTIIIIRILHISIIHGLILQDT